MPIRHRWEATRSSTWAVAEYERSLLDGLAKAEQKVAGLEQDVVKAGQRTRLQTLTAPVDGIVQQLAIHTIGGVVTPAQALMIVVSADSRLEIEAMVTNRDIGFVEVGQEVDQDRYIQFHAVRAAARACSKRVQRRDHARQGAG